MAIWWNETNLTFDQTLGQKFVLYRVALGIDSLAGQRFGMGGCAEFRAFQRA